MFQIYWHKCRKQNISGKQGICQCSLMIKNKYCCQTHSTYAYYCWAQSLLDYLLFSFKSYCQFICITNFNVLSWSLPSALYPTIKMSCSILNTFGRSLKISVIFCLNKSPAGTSPNGSVVNLYLPNWHANVVNYENFNHVLGCGSLCLHYYGHIACNDNEIYRTEMPPNPNGQVCTNIYNIHDQSGKPI